MIKENKKKIIAIILVIFVTWFVWQRFNNKNNGSDTDETTVSRGDLTETVSASGEIVPVNYANLSFATPALIEWIGADVGDSVKKGQELIKLDRNSIIAEIQSAQIDVEKAILAEKLARRNWDSYKPEERKKIKKDVEQSRTRLYGAQSLLSKTMLTSPIDGIVTQKNVNVGEIASGTVMRVIDESVMEIDVLFSETDAVKIHKGQKAFATFDAFNDEKFNVDIESIDPESVVIQDVTYYKATFLLSGEIDREILSGMSVDVDVVVAEKKNSLMLPLRFVRRDDQGEYVYVRSTEAGKYDKKYIKTGVESDDGDVEIIDGIGEGDMVYVIYEE